MESSIANSGLNALPNAAAEVETSQQAAESETPTAVPESRAPQALGATLLRDTLQSLSDSVATQLASMSRYVATLSQRMDRVERDSRPYMLKDLLRAGDWMAKIDLKDAYFMIPIGQEDRELLKFQWKDRLYQFNCLPFGLSSSPWVFSYQDHTASRGMPDYIYQQHSCHGRDRVSITKPYHSSGVPAGESGICDQPPQVTTHPISRDRVPGVHCQLLLDGAETPREEDQKDKGQGRQSPASSLSVSPCPVLPHWENECGNTGHLDGLAVLQEPPILPQRGSSGGPRVLLSGDPNTGGPRGIGMVEGPFHPVEWAEPNSSQLFPHHRDRNLKEGVGGSVRRSPHRGPMEPRGEQATHQLPGTPGSFPGSEVFCKRQNQCDNPPQDGEYVSDDVYQQAGGDDLPTAELPSQEAMAVVHGEEHPPQSPAPSRCIEHHC